MAIGDELPHPQRRGHRPRNLPLRDFEHNRVWLQLVLLAHPDLRDQRLLLSGELALAEPRRLRYRLLHVAARTVSTAAAPACAYKKTAPGPASSPPRSRASTRYHHQPDPADALTTSHPPRQTPPAAATRRHNTHRHPRGRAVVPVRRAPRPRPASPVDRRSTDHAPYGRTGPKIVVQPRCERGCCGGGSLYAINTRPSARSVGNGCPHAMRAAVFTRRAVGWRGADQPTSKTEGEDRGRANHHHRARRDAHRHCGGSSTGRGGT